MTQHITKELPVLPITPLQSWWDSGNEQFIELEMLFKAYGQQCAAHAREKALEEARLAAWKFMWDYAIGSDGHKAATETSYAIEALKGK